MSNSPVPDSDVVATTSLSGSHHILSGGHNVPCVRFHNKYYPPDKNIFCSGTRPPRLKTAPGFALRKCHQFSRGKKWRTRLRAHSNESFPAAH